MGLLSLQAPWTAQNILPGQFVHLSVGDSTSRFVLRRPLSVYNYDADEGTIDIFYQVVGKGSTAIYNFEPGRKLSCVGPVGRPWSMPLALNEEGSGVPDLHNTARDYTKALLVGGGVGCAPLTPLYKALLASGVEVQMIRGAQNAALIQDLGSLDFDPQRQNILIATDDGSVGHHGFVTDLVRECLGSGEFDHVATCGPEPMQRIVVDLAYEAGVYCEVSLERRMACGIGACLSCVVDTTEGKKRACVDGPVFDASVVVW
jgi:dihydroorotate dehydrogenase electron transfer subunit